MQVLLNVSTDEQLLHEVAAILWLVSGSLVVLELAP